MLVILTNSQLLSPNQVCQNCLMATQQGQPRWQHGQLLCGRAVGKLSEGQPEQFECQMGFRIANID